MRLMRCIKVMACLKTMTALTETREIPGIQAMITLAWRGMRWAAPGIPLPHQPRELPVSAFFP